MTDDIAIYTVRPGGTSLWLPSVTREEAIERLPELLAYEFKAA